MKMLARQANQKMIDAVCTKDKLPEKKKRKSSIEKSLDAVFDNMKQTADADFER